MAVTSKQFSYLNEMGISLWQRKNLAHQATDTEQPTIDNAPTISLAELASQRIFQDIVQALGCELSDIEQQQNQLMIGDICWQFSEQQAMSLNNGKLLTPMLSELSSNPNSKKALWQLLIQHQ